MNEIATGVLYRRINREQFFLSNTFALITTATALGMLNFKKNRSSAAILRKLEPAVLAWIFGSSMDIFLLFHRSDTLGRLFLDDRAFSKLSRNLNKIGLATNRKQQIAAEQQLEQIRDEIKKEKSEVEEAVEKLRDIENEIKKEKEIEKLTEKK